MLFAVTGVAIIYYMYTKYVSIVSTMQDLRNQISAVKSSYIDKSKSNSTEQSVKGLEVGTIVMFSGVNIPVNYALCNGSQLSISEHQELFVAIGTTYNKPDIDANLYFNLPDLRNQFIRCIDETNDQRKIGSFEQYKTALPRNMKFSTNTTGDHNHSCSTDGNHFHDTIWSNINMSSTSYTYSGPNIVRHWMNSGNADSTTSSACGTSWNGNHSHTISTSGSHSHSITSGGDNETCPNNIALYFIIKIR